MKTSSEAAAPASHRHSLNGATMGTRYTAVLYAPAGLDSGVVGADLFAAVDEVDRQMSAWNPASDLCRLNAAPVGVWIGVPGALAEVLDAGLQVGRQSHGAFDMGVARLVDAWGFGPSCRQVTAAPAMPPRQAGERTVLEVDRAARRVRKGGPACIDLAGIAKGYGVDRLAACLDRWGIADYLVGIDGEMRARGAKPGGQPWRIAIEKPVYGIREVAGAMELADTAVATSGDYRHWVDVAGKRYSHTMDPATGRPVANRVASVTVLAPTCMLADAWATALLVLGEHDGVRLARELRIDALFMLRDGERIEELWVAADAPAA